MSNITLILMVIGIIILTLGTGFLIANILSNKKIQRWEKREEAINSKQSLLNFYGLDILINGKPMDEYDMHKGEMGKVKKTFTLPPGAYETIGEYSFRGDKIGKTFIAKEVKLNFTLEPGREYDLGTYNDDEIIKFSVANTKLDDPKFPEGYYVSCMKHS